LTFDARVPTPTSLSNGAPSQYSRSSRKLTLWPLIAATFFMVSGGTYGTEDIIGGAGYGLGILILLLTPVLWSLPTALMIGELATAMPHEGGYYAWVRRAMGDFWGFQEAWLSLAASIFDMAIYPTLFVLYLQRLFPWFGIGNRGVIVALGIVTVCTLLNLAGIHVVGKTSMWLFVILSAPFVIMTLLALARVGAFEQATFAPARRDIGLLTGILICMWNYMGWDNASTIAAEVHDPQRTYSRAILAALALVAISYIVPAGAIWFTGIPHTSFETGSWADLAGVVGGNWLRIGLVAGGMISAFGMFNALVMSYSRLPLAMAQDGLLPRAFSKTLRSTRAPWVSIVALAIAWAFCLSLGFQRLITIDILLYGASLTLEFVALIVLRIKAPALPRPYKVPGGLVGAIALAVPPVALLGLSIVASHSETVFGINGLVFGAMIACAGVIAYAIKVALHGTGWFVRESEPAG
jgi:amino acid transporter